MKLSEHMYLHEEPSELEAHWPIFPAASLILDHGWGRWGLKARGRGRSLKSRPKMSLLLFNHPNTFQFFSESHKTNNN